MLITEGLFVIFLIFLQFNYQVALGVNFFFCLRSKGIFGFLTLIFCNYHVGQGCSGLLINKKNWCMHQQVGGAIALWAACAVPLSRLSLPSRVASLASHHPLHGGLMRVSLHYTMELRRQFFSPPSFLSPPTQEVLVFCMVLSVS